MEGVVVRRVIPSDNSCLFNAVGYVCHSTVPVLSNYLMIVQIKLFLFPLVYAINMFLIIPCNTFFVTAM
jgi:hypothetical protein